MCSDCPPFHEIIHFIQKKYKLIVKSGNLLRQSSIGVDGTKEAVFGWHQDNVNNQRKAILTIIVLLNEKKRIFK